MNKVCTGIFSQPLESMCEKIVSGLMSTFMLPVYLTHLFIPSLSHPAGSQLRGELRNKSLVFKIKFCETCCHHQVLQHPPIASLNAQQIEVLSTPLSRGEKEAKKAVRRFLHRGVCSERWAAGSKIFKFDLLIHREIRWLEPIPRLNPWMTKNVFYFPLPSRSLLRKIFSAIVALFPDYSFRWSNVFYLLISEMF